MTEPQDITRQVGAYSSRSSQELWKNREHDGASSNGSIPGPTAFPLAEFPSGRYLTFGALTIDLAAVEARYARNLINITHTQYKILCLLANNPRRAIPSSVIISEVWGPWFGPHHVVQVHISRLRSELAAAGADPQMIRTIRGIGYRFDPPAAEPDVLRVLPLPS